MPDIFTMIFTFVTSFPVNIIIVAGIIIYVLYYIYNKRKPKEDEFQIEDFRESVFLSTEKLIDTFGIRINATLTRGIEPLGKINRFYHFTGKVTPDDIDGSKRPEEDKNIDKKADLWIFRLGEKTLIDKILGGGAYDYLVLDSKFLDAYDGNKKQWPVKEDISFTPYGNVFIASKVGEAFINDISYRRSLEEIRTLMQNFPRKVAYLELKQAKTLEKMEASVEKKRTGYESYKKSVLASGKDLEDDDDESD